MKKFLFILMLLNLTSTISRSQSDIKDSKDHSLISRYEGAWIIRYVEKEFETIEYPVSVKLDNNNRFSDTQKTDGIITSIEYNLPEGITATQIFKNYLTQLNKAGFKISFECEKQACEGLPLLFTRKYLSNASSQLGNAMIGNNGSYLVASTSKDGQEYIVILVVGESSREKSARYRIDIIQKKQMDTDKVSISEMTETIKREGKVALYGINFEFNSALIQDSSTENLELISAYLQKNKDVDVFIVGHTDNVGDYEKNIALSQKRAEAIVDFLIKNHSIDKSRLTPVGVSMVSPVASNATEEGRAKNRRVEVVLK